MAFFDFMRKDPQEKIIEDIASLLLNTECFKYFSKDDSFLMSEYKKLQVFLFSAALHGRIIDSKYGSKSFESEINGIQSIYFKKATLFYQTYIKTRKLKLSILSPEDMHENAWLGKVFVIFNSNLADIKNIFLTKKAYCV